MSLSEAGMELREKQIEQAAFEADADKKKKTAGGVFLTLLKKDSRVTPEMRRKIFKAETERRRQRKYT